MGTRGTLGFIIDGEEKLAYNHFDSYPGGLGSDVIDFIAATNAADNPSVAWDLVKGQARALRLVTDDTPPTEEDIKRLNQYHDSGVSTGSTTEWYSLLRNLQGSPAAYLEAGVMEDGHTFPLDSLFCEYGYIINLDDDVLEFYRGFQTQQHDKGRFAGRLPDPTKAPYFEIALVGTWPLASPPTVEEIEAAAQSEEARA